MTWLPHPSGSGEGEAPAPGNPRRDHLPLWVIVILALFLVVRLYDIGVAPFVRRPPSLKAAATQGKEDEFDDDSMQDLLQADLQAKTAYVSALSRPAAEVRPDARLLGQALQAAVQLQKETQNAPGAARRLILLRALVEIAMPGAKDVPPLAAGKNGLDPLAAFGSALPSDLPARERARFAAEGRLWQTVFEGGALSPGQIAALAVQIRRLPNIRWWKYPALQVLYTQQGDLSVAGQYARQARDAALPSLLPFGLLGALRVAFVLAGILILVYFLIRNAQSRETPPGAAPPTDLWPTVPAAIPLAQRRLGAGDLMGVFVLYLVSREVIAFLLVGFTGSHLPYLHHFQGLLAPFRPALDRMSSAQRDTAGIVLESAIYLLSAVPPFVMLWSLARRRGASLADEIGWTRRHLGLNLLYGAGGFAIASALMIPVSLLARWLFRHAPDPSNPVIPQLIDTSGFWGMFLLIALASFAAPVVEEVLFRGVFYNAAKLRLGVWPAIVLTGLVFGFVHPVGIAEMLAIGTLGGVFAWMAETRKSLAPSMFAHFLQNFTTTLLLLTVLSG